MLNLYMFIPSSIPEVPLVLTIDSYFESNYEMANGFTLLLTWTLPAPIGGYLSAGNDWRVVVLIKIIH